MEEYALLVGTFMVLIVVGVLMFLTRNLPVAPAATGASTPSLLRRFGKIGQPEPETEAVGEMEKTRQE